MKPAGKQIYLEVSVYFMKILKTYSSVYFRTSENSFVSFMKALDIPSCWRLNSNSKFILKILSGIFTTERHFSVDHYKFLFVTENKWILTMCIFIYITQICIYFIISTLISQRINLNTNYLLYYLIIFHIIKYHKLVFSSIPVIRSYKQFWDFHFTHHIFVRTSKKYPILS